MKKRPPTVSARASEAAGDPTAAEGLAGLRRAWRQHKTEHKIQHHGPIPRERAPALPQADPPVQDADFVAAVGPVHVLKAPERRRLRSASCAPIPRQRLADERAVMREALSDGMGAEQWLQTDEALSFVRSGMGADVLRKLSRGHWSVQGELDLHGLRKDEARECVGEFLRIAQARRWRCVKIIHGKGLGSPGKNPILKGLVKNWLQQKQEVIAFAQAPIHHGGAGALLLLLRD